MHSLTLFTPLSPVLPELSCAPPYLPHQPVEALLWVLGIENGCELRVFESTPGKPTMQVQSLGGLCWLCVFVFRNVPFVLLAFVTVTAGLDSAKA